MSLIVPEGVERTIGEPEPTYYVWRKNGDAPKKPYPNRFSAEVAASRLAAKHPGEEFLVMKVKSGFRQPVDNPVDA